MSIIWTHFGFSEDSAAKGNITKLFNYLEHNHITE